MTRRTESDIEKLVSLGFYEEALGVSFEATDAELARAHIRQLHRYAYSETRREALNHARTILSGESIERKVQRLLNIEQLEAARCVMLKVIEDHSSAYNLYMLGYILYRMGRYVESAKYMKSAFSLSQSPFHAIWFGYALERQGKLREALAQYLWAIERRGNETEHRLAGTVYFHLGDSGNACRFLEKAVSMGCRDEDVLEKIAIATQKLKYAKLISRVKSMFRIGRAENNSR